ncbi:hypothetical protein TFLX_04001 [Thermoflexales bacterium]|nr:hypothetical protein TFLX_04001 [Thermoflexales bacterium]
MAKIQREIDDERKENEYQDLMLLAQYSPLVKIEALDAGHGHPPTQYRITYTCRGYRAPGSIAERFVVSMTLPADYPRVLPDFHCVEPTSIYHPHIHDDWICIGHQRGMPVGLPLREYVVGVGEMIQWRKDTDGLGKPVDERPLEGAEPEPARPQPQVSAQTPLPPRPPRHEDKPLLIEVVGVLTPAATPAALTPSVSKLSRPDEASLVIEVVESNSPQPPSPARITDPSEEALIITVDGPPTESDLIVLDDKPGADEDGLIVISAV